MKNKRKGLDTMKKFPSPYGDSLFLILCLEVLFTAGLRDWFAGHEANDDIWIGSTCLPKGAKPVLDRCGGFSLSFAVR